LLVSKSNQSLLLVIQIKVFACIQLWLWKQSGATKTNANISLVLFVKMFMPHWITVMVVFPFLSRCCSELAD